jgi:hypothetical protein
MKNVYLSISNKADREFTQLVTKTIEKYDCKITSYEIDMLGVNKADLMIVIPPYPNIERNKPRSKFVGKGIIHETRIMLAKGKNVYIAGLDDGELCFYRIKDTQVMDNIDFIHHGFLIYASTMKSQLNPTVMGSNGIGIKSKVDITVENDADWLDDDDDEWVDGASNLKVGQPKKGTIDVAVGLGKTGTTNKKKLRLYLLINHVLK